MKDETNSWSEKELDPGWLKRGLESARKELASWPDGKRKMMLGSLEFPIKLRKDNL